MGSQKRERHTMIAASRNLPVETGPDPVLHASDLAMLEHLRHVARTSRCKGYVDLFGACAALSGNPRVAAKAASEVLMRCLSQALGRRPLLLREGESETTFDENWLLALARSLRTNDVDSATFLLNSRVPGYARRNLTFLMGSVVDSFARV
jgi:hypothetical protein